MVEFSQKWLYSGKSGCIRAKVVLIGQTVRVRTKVVVFGQGGCIRLMWLSSDKMVVFRQKWL